MVSYRRKQGSTAQTKFCNRYLLPVFGKPDVDGNYTLVVCEKPSIAFMAHHDTVHKHDGRDKPEVLDDFVVSGSQDVLGADCTTGIFLILRMIQANVPGVYVVHAAEEIGCIGSRALAKSNPYWLTHVKAAISLDRKGYDSVITHQLDERTCSDAFGRSLADILDMDFKLDDTGVYTDSNEYAGIIPECTNLSVGYFKQHTVNEHQDWVFMMALGDALVSADWSKLVIERNPAIREYTRYTRGWGSFDDYEYDWAPYVDEKPSKAKGIRTGYLEGIEEIVQKYPLQVAKLLDDMGYSPDGLLDDVSDYLSRQRYY